VSLIAITRAVSRSLQDCELTWLSREPINIDKAIAEHHAYERCLESLGARVISLPALEEHPDAVFVEDPAIVLDEVAVITTMGAPSRRGEQRSLAAALAEFRPLLFMRLPGKLEGGDVMRVGRDLYVGLSARTDQAGVDQLRELLKPFGYRVTALRLRDCLHLKSACCCIGENTVLINRDWVDAEPLAPYRLIDVAPEEPWAANALPISGTIVMADAFPLTIEQLRAAGFTLRPVNVTELMKAESGVTCSSLILTD
jgi:dimethylargininase